MVQQGKLSEETKAKRSERGGTRGRGAKSGGRGGGRGGKAGKTELVISNLISYEFMLLF